MEFLEKKPPRTYETGFKDKVLIKDCGNLHLAPDEQVTFITERANEYDLTRKNWGYYMGPSLNGRLADFNFRPVLVKNRINRFFMLLVEKDKEDLFGEYVRKENLKIVCWMDTSAALTELEKRMAS